MPDPHAREDVGPRRVHLYGLGRVSRLRDEMAQFGFDHMPTHVGPKDESAHRARCEAHAERVAREEPIEQREEVYRQGARPRGETRRLIALCLLAHGPLLARLICQRAVLCRSSVTKALSSPWFVRLSHGLYDLTPLGRRMARKEMP